MLNSNATEFTGKCLVEYGMESLAKLVASSNAVRDVVSLTDSWFIKMHFLSFVAFVD
jgi:hypothetical protein